MKTRARTLLCAVAIALMAFVSVPTPTYAWPWSTQARLVATASYSSIWFFNGLRCGTATVTLHNGMGTRTVMATSTGWNSCRADFGLVPVSGSRSYWASVTFSGTLSPSGSRVTGQNGGWVTQPGWGDTVNLPRVTLR